MDDRFDNLAKGLAKGMPRRRALRLIAASIGAGAVALLPGVASAAPQTCVTCVCGTGNPCNPKSTTCTELRGFPANQTCEQACARANQHLCSAGNAFHCPHGCP
jgi:hypothetical protein